MTHVRRRTVLHAASLAWITAYPLAGCGAASGPAVGPGPNILDERSPFVEPARRPIPACADADQGAAIAVWTKLRKNDYPYHVQTVAVSPPFPSGCRALIIAEPPPTVSLDDLRAVAPQLLANAETHQHVVGYDGWTRDVVVTLPPVNDAELTELIAGLHSALFATTYRMAALDTSQPVPRYDPKAAPLDLGIGPGELRHWLLEGTTSFTPVRGGRPAAFKDLLAADEPEVYLDDAHGLVAWIVPRRSDVAEMADLVRQFTLESDIIVGAVTSSTTVAILARQRAIDPRVLQPLRFETVSLLAAAHDKESLQQSYERTNPLAGRFDDTRDWAPIFLSPELLDTEYGSVLDIADQFLKSWSNNGKTQYINFSYPPPRTWAFPAPVFVVSKANKFRYNWNTANVGAVVKVDDVDVFWLRRTGALNVSYFPDEDELAEPQPAKQSGVKDLEEKAYQFFVKTQTPILARVVQYNALFQIFARFNIGSSNKLPTPSHAAATQTLVAAARGALTAIRDADDAEIKRRLAAFLKRQTKYLRKTFLGQLRAMNGKLPPELLATLGVEQFTSDFDAELREQAITDVKAVSKALGKLDTDGLAELGALLGDPRSATGIREDVFPVYKQVRELGQRFPPFANPEVYKAYADNVAARPDAWIHTPSIVISWNQPPIDNVVGGHNLDAKVTALTFHAERASMAAEQIAARRPVDAVGARELDRLELGAQGPRLASAPANRPARVALGNVNTHAFWPEPGGRPSAEPTMASSDGAVVTRQSDGYRVVDVSGAVHEVTTMPEVVELISKSPRVKAKDVAIRFEGFQPDEVRLAVRAAEVRTRAHLAGVVKPPPEFATRPLDFSKATLGETQTRTYSDGAAEIGHILEIAGAKPISIEIKVAVQKASPGLLERLSAKIKSLIKALVGHFSGGSVSPQDFGIELRKQLNDLLREELRDQIQDDLRDELFRDLHRLELKMKQESSDFTIVQREVPASHGTGDLAV
jgi:hypothetical protein